MGVDDTGLAIKKDTVTALRIMSAENMTYTAEATSKAYVSGIIDKNDTDATSTSGKTMNLTFYDNLGYSYTAKLKMTEQADGQYGLKLSDILDSKNVSVMDQYPNISLGTYQAYTTPVTAQAASLTITPPNYQIGSATAVSLDDLATEQTQWYIQTMSLKLQHCMDSAM